MSSFDLPDEVFEAGEERPLKEKKSKKRKAVTVLHPAAAAWRFEMTRERKKSDVLRNPQVTRSTRKSRDDCTKYH